MVPFSQGPLIKVEQTGVVSIARFTQADFLDMDVVGLVGDQLLALARSIDRPLIVLDFGAVYCPASALWGKLVSLSQQVRRRDGRVVLCNLAPDLLHLVETLRLTGIFPVYADEQEAVRALETPPQEKA